MKHLSLVLMCCLPGALNAQVSGIASGLPAAFGGDVRMRWLVLGDEQKTARLRDITQALIVGDGAVGEGNVTEFRIAVPEGAVLELVSAPSFIPEALPGFGAIYGDVWPVAVDADGQRALESGQFDAQGAWFGLRNRFYAVLLTDVAGARIIIDTGHENEPVMTLEPVEGQREIAFRLYAGPVEHGALRAADPVLAKMLFAALWNWLRWLCFGMLWLLTAIDGVIGNIGVSIVLLSVAVKILMSPLTKAADRLQDSVNRTAALLQPELDAIKREYKGEEAHNRVLAVYKKHGVHPLYTMKSLAGFLLQIPIFIAAFDMLGENYALHEVSFLWIEDLAKPDQWLALPFVLPFFGGYLNLLPCLMTAFTLLTSWLQHEASLNVELNRRQQSRLFWMAGAFFLLFYTFPAGMVLYWTTNNVLALIRVGIGKSFNASGPRSGGPL